MYAENITAFEDRFNQNHIALANERLCYHEQSKSFCSYRPHQIRFPMFCTTCGRLLYFASETDEDGEPVTCGLPNIDGTTCGGDVRLPKSQAEVNGAVVKLLFSNKSILNDVA